MTNDKGQRICCWTFCAFGFLVALYWFTILSLSQVAEQDILLASEIATMTARIGKVKLGGRVGEGSGLVWSRRRGGVRASCAEAALALIERLVLALCSECTTTQVTLSVTSTTTFRDHNCVGSFVVAVNEAFLGGGRSSFSTPVRHLVARVLDSHTRANAASATKRPPFVTNHVHRSHIHDSSKSTTRRHAAAASPKERNATQRNATKERNASIERSERTNTRTRNTQRPSERSKRTRSERTRSEVDGRSIVRFGRLVWSSVRQSVRQFKLSARE